eukprot:7032952-Pyramimonas_sp.AAC.1
MPVCPRADHGRMLRVSWHIHHRWLPLGRWCVQDLQRAQVVLKLAIQRLPHGAHGHVADDPLIGPSR